MNRYRSRATVLPLIFVLALAASWVGNFIKLTDCDFKSDYKCEVVHVLGIVPTISLITVWFDFEEGVDSE